MAGRAVVEHTHEHEHEHLYATKESLEGPGVKMAGGVLDIYTRITLCSTKRLTAC